VRKFLAGLLVLLLGLSLLIYSHSQNQLHTYGDYIHQNLKWQSCGDTFQCANFQVPVDYSKPSRDRFTLQVLRHRAEGKYLGTLFVNPGGPGASAVDYASNAQSIVSPEIYSSFDIVGLDPRGVGGSSPLRCLTDKQEDAYLSNFGEATSPQVLMGMMKASQDFVAACKKNAGNRIGHYSTLESAKDMEVLRQIMGLPKLNYLGKSYGTYLGALYGSLYPDKVGRFVLDGAIDPGVPYDKQMLAQAVGFDRALQDFFTAKDGDISSMTKRLIADSYVRPLKNKSGRVLTNPLLITAIAAGLYDDTNAWGPLFDAITSAVKEKNPDGLFALADMYYDRNGQGHYVSNQNDIAEVITCNDWRDRRTLNQVAADSGLFAQSAPIFGPTLNYSDLPCRYWPASPTVASRGYRLQTPVIVVGGVKDPATPYPWAVGLAHQIGSAVLLRYTGEGHTGYLRGDSCIDSSVNAYLVAGKVPSTSLSCVDGGH
jgi:pimeloyl-ACP methyl ester carboxylesterase